MKNEIKSKIKNLNDNDLVEASGYFLIDKLGILQLPDIEETIQKEGLSTEEITSLIEQVGSDREEYRNLLRFILLSSIEENEPEIKLAIEGAGQKQGITEIVPVLSLAMAFIIELYRMSQTKSIESEKEEVEFEKASDGYKLTYKKESIYTKPGSALGKIIEMILKKPSKADIGS